MFCVPLLSSLCCCLPLLSLNDHTGSVDLLSHHITAYENQCITWRQRAHHNQDRRNGIT